MLSVGDMSSQSGLTGGVVAAVVVVIVVVATIIVVVVVRRRRRRLLKTKRFDYCLSNAIHGIGQI